jgi:hypothetical protein
LTRAGKICRCGKNLPYFLSDSLTDYALKLTFSAVARTGLLAEVMLRSILRPGKRFALKTERNFCSNCQSHSQEPDLQPSTGSIAADRFPIAALQAKTIQTASPAT